MVTPRYLPEIGGVEQHVAQVSRRLVDRGCDVTVLATDREGSLLERESLEGVEIRRVRAWPARSDLYLAPALRAVIRDGDWDVVHVQSYHTFVAPLAMQAASAARLPFVLTFHGGGHSSRLRKHGRGLQRRALRPLIGRAARLIALTRFEIDAYRHDFGVPIERFVLIPNGVDLPPARVAAAQRADGPRIASIGRLERYKGHHRAIRALPYVLDHEPDARLWIGGRGPYEAKLRRLAAELHVEDRVEIRAIPPEAREQMAQELAATDLVVLLSDFETHPIAALEALALGRPVLLADNSGMSELAAETGARAIDPEIPPRELAAEMLGQLGSPAASSPLGTQGWDECADRLLDLYEQVVACAY
jgi:glycosyltransferase involved in cell wall biosynthesis